MQFLKSSRVAGFSDIGVVLCSRLLPASYLRNKERMRKGVLRSMRRLSI